MLELIDLSGYTAIALLMFIESVVSPIPSEAIMPRAGFRAGQRDVSLAGVVIAESVGSLAGSTLSS